MYYFTNKRHTRVQPAHTFRRTQKRAGQESKGQEPSQYFRVRNA